MSNEKYIAGYQKVQPEWLRPLVEDFETRETRIFIDSIAKPDVMNTNPDTVMQLLNSGRITIDEAEKMLQGDEVTKLVEQTIPIYTRKRPHPIKNKADCPLEINYKQGLRMLMLRELNAGGDQQAVVDRFKKKVEQL
jgi:hypothetical protein